MRLYLLHIHTKLHTESYESCVACLKDENTNIRWHRYELPCHHQMHTRCCRKWIFEKGKLNCRFCGDIDTSQTKSQYCSTCNKWGYWFKTCTPKV